MATKYWLARKPESDLTAAQVETLEAIAKGDAVAYSEGVAVSDPSAISSSTVTDSSGGTAATADAGARTIAAVSDVAGAADAIAGILEEQALIKADLASVRSQLVALLTSLEGAELIAT